MAISFQWCQSLAAVNAFKTCFHWHDMPTLILTHFLHRALPITCYSHASADSMHISSFTMNSALGPPSIIDWGCDAATWQRTNMCLPLSLPCHLACLYSELVAYPVCHMCTKICCLHSKCFLVVLQLPLSYKASIIVTHFPAAIDQLLRVAIAWTLWRPTWSLQK